MLENKVEQFRKSHKKDQPLVLMNCWNVASATELTKKIIKLVPTSSYAMSTHYGYQDGETMPFTEILDYIKQMDPITNYITADIESGYASTLTSLAENIEALINIGVVGINIEDKRPNTEVLYTITEQSERLDSIKQQLNTVKKDLFINVRTDTYFTGDIIKNNQDEQVLNQTIHRIKAYEKTGIDGIFIPGLKNKEHIKKIATETTIPLNIMLDIHEDSIEEYLNTGISRISFGPSIYLLYNKNTSKNLDHFYTALVADITQYEEQKRIELFKIK